MINGYIYKLSFCGTNQVYIGQTINPHIRFTKHLNLLKKNRGSKKLQEAYEKYGIPTYEIILDGLTSQKELDAAEDEAIELYNSCHNGFNTHEKSRAGFAACYGELNGNSKFTNAEIVEFMRFMLDNRDIRLREAADLFSMSYVTADEICRGIKHKWLSEAYPEEHKDLLAIVGTRSKGRSAEELGIKYPTIYSPEGVSYQVTALREFARTHNLNNTCLCSVLHGKQKSHKGWSLIPLME